MSSSEQSTQDNRQKAIDGLREFADWLEAHPDAETPRPINRVSVLHFVTTAEELSGLARSLGGKWEKDIDDDAYRLKREIGGCEYKLYAFRERICTARIVKKTKTVTERDPETVEKILAAIPEVTRTVEIEETVWDCPESLLAEEASIADGYDALDGEIADMQVER